MAHDLKPGAKQLEPGQESVAATMASSCQAVCAVLIAGSQGPLQVKKDYLIQWNGGAASGHIRSIRERLKSPFVTRLSESLLHSRELAFVELGMTSLPVPLHRVQQLTFLEPVTQEKVGTGLLFLQGVPDDNRDTSFDLQGLTVWFTGLSGAGKTTIAQQVYERLRSSYTIEMLDAEVVRTYLCKDLGYSREDRTENVRRLGFVANLLTQKGIIVLIPAIAPYLAGRDAVRRAISRFVEVYVNAPLEVCEQRDVKGLYKKARTGEISMFTGIDDPYEPPLSPEVECRTDRESIEVSVSKVITVIDQRMKDQRMKL
jgi:adenylyl-sulfate kinase